MKISKGYFGPEWIGQRVVLTEEHGTHAKGSVGLVEDFDQDDPDSPLFVRFANREGAWPRYSSLMPADVLYIGDCFTIIERSPGEYSLVAKMVALTPEAIDELATVMLYIKMKQEELKE